MRALLLRALVAAVAASALPAAALPTGIHLFIDGGTFQFDCGESPAVGTIKDAVDACAATHGFATTFGFGGCFLTAINGKAGASIDPTGFWLAGNDWMVRENGLLSDVGVCDRLEPGTLVTIDYELIVGYFAAAPTPGTAAWFAAHLP